jgi:hypothetical protein
LVTVLFLMHGRYEWRRNEVGPRRNDAGEKSSAGMGSRESGMMARAAWPTDFAAPDVIL